MPDQYRSGDKFHDLSAIDSGLAELEQEKQQLVALRECAAKIEASVSRFRFLFSRTKDSTSEICFVAALIFLPITGKTGEDEVAIP